MEFQIRHLALFLLSNRHLLVVLNEKSLQEYAVKAGVSQGPFLVLHFSYYTLMTYLMMLSVILLSMLMIPLSILGVIWLLICGNNVNWFLNLNLIYETLCTGVRSGLLISKLVLFDRSNKNGSIDVKMDGSVLEEKSSFKMLGLTFSSKLDWGS